MKNRHLNYAAALATALSFPVNAFPAAHGEVRAIAWNDLRPAPATGVAASGERLVEALAGETIELSGYVLPVDQEGDLVYEFILVPWAGACSHTPPPPVNQVVHVIPEKPYKLSRIYEPVAITGALKTGIEQTQLFILDGVTVVASGYTVGKAAVRHDASLSDAEPRGVGPWRFLQK